jgi:S-(hydroxymethyl)glutathione dehydrogenase/alcohol dehydrogenase
MKAAVLTKLNAPLEILNVEPLPLDFGQVLVRVVSSGVCGAQLAEIRGEKGNAGFLPHLLGHEGCGIVVEVGVGVTKVKTGDRVVMHWRKGLGIESPLPRYRINGEIRTSGRVTTFSELSVCSENRLTAIPDDVPSDLAALLGCGLSTALSTIERDAGVKMGESVMIIGLGGLGVNLLRAARLAHASPIVCVDVRPGKRALAEELGAIFLDADLAEPCRCACDVVIDTAGTPESIASGLEHLAPSGRFVMVGQPKSGATVEIRNAAHFFQGDGKVLRATQGGGFAPDLDISRYLKLWRTGKLNIEGIITHRVGLNEINSGLDLVRAGEASRVIVDMV